MRCSLRLLLPLVVMAACVGAHAQGLTYNVGRAATDEEMKQWDIAITPGGKELPPGNGTAKQGAEVYKQKCASCHGPTATEGPATKLVGGLETLKTKTPVKTVNYWPFATTVWDYINRAMPMNQELTLKPD